MMVRKFLLLCLFFETCASSLLAMEPAEIKEWTPARLHEPKVLKNISELIKKEKHECVINSLDESRKDYGFSRAGVHALQKTLLTKVKTSYEKNKAEQRPFFLDLGAGHGYMSWKAAVAGAYVVSVEKQEPTAQLMCQNMAKAKPFLAPRESVKNICKLYPGDVLDFTKPYYNNLYDFVWAGYLIHFLKPTQAKSLISTLFKSMKEGA